jgi:hypothetical protein
MASKRIVAFMEMGVGEEGGPPYSKRSCRRAHVECARFDKCTAQTVDVQQPSAVRQEGQATMSLFSCYDTTIPMRRIFVLLLEKAAFSNHGRTLQDLAELQCQIFRYVIVFHVQLF